MPNTIDVFEEKESSETKKFTKEDFEKALQALQRLRERTANLQPVDAVALIREIRDCIGIHTVRPSTLPWRSRALGKWRRRRRTQWRSRSSGHAIAGGCAFRFALVSLKTPA